VITFYYWYPASSFAVHVALEESGLPYEAICIDPKCERQLATLREISPRGTVPAISVDGRALVENVAIMCYVASRAPDAGLLPEEAMERAQCLSLVSWGSSTVHINFRRVYKPEKFTSDAAAFDQIRANGRSDFWRDLELLDRRLRAERWMIGEKFTVADAYFLRVYEWGKIAQLPVESLKHYSEFANRLVARPTIASIIKREGRSLLSPS